jgi:hypothetical protein
VSVDGFSTAGWFKLMMSCKAAWPMKVFQLMEKHYKYKPPSEEHRGHHEFSLHHGLSAQNHVPPPALPPPLAAIAAVIPRTLSGDELTQTTNTLIFSTPLSKFLYIISFRPQSSSMDWNDDGCSNSPDEPLGFNFLPSCQRHDFAYRNFKKQDRFTEEQRERIDKNFLTDLEGMCKEERTPRRERSCKRVAGFNYKTVRRLGVGLWGGCGGGRVEGLVGWVGRFAAMA